MTSERIAGEWVEAHPVLDCCQRQVLLRLPVYLDGDGDRAILHDDVHRALAVHLRTCDPP